MSHHVISVVRDRVLSTVRGERRVETQFTVTEPSNLNRPNPRKCAPATVYVG